MEQFSELLKFNHNDMSIFTESLQGSIDPSQPSILQNLLNLKYLKKFCKVTELVVEQPPKANEQVQALSPIMQALKSHLIKMGLYSWLGALKQSVQVVVKSKK